MPTSPSSPRGNEIVDEGTFVARPVPPSSDPLAYPGYADTLERARAGSGAPEAIACGPAELQGHELEIALFDFSFLGGSMGESTGEALAVAMERAAARRVPFLLRTSTGGARMHEGMRALVQMPKVVAARLELAAAHQPFVALLGHPTTGGVLASLGGLADVTLAETGATIGFAGPRVVERFTGSPLRAGSHSAETAFEKGLVDALVPRDHARVVLGGLLGVLAPDRPEDAPAPAAWDGNGPDDPWAVVQTARAPDHPRAPRLLRDASDALFELRGDRAGADDPALAAALVRIAGRRALALALDRAHAPGPAAYRKALRCLEIAERLELPIVTLVDTPGADPSEASEAGGIAWSIASLFEAMLTTEAPVLAVVTGEGGSGGALAFATADTVVAYAGAFFSVIAPEGAAVILWRDASRAPDAARVLKLTAPDLLQLGIVDAVAPGVADGASLRGLVAYHLERLTQTPPDGRAQQRRKRWRHRG